MELAAIEIAAQRVKLPSGREITPLEALKFCYNLSETDIEILIVMLQGGKYDVETLANKLGLSKATINRSLNKLAAIGFVERERETRKTAGRPRYFYYIRDPANLLSKIQNDLDFCAKAFEEGIKNMLLSSLRKAVAKTNE
ncbi:HTH-type transcriptional regulator Lrs14 [Pyrolobus fumarii]|uniref:HTH-type transcriptional regulator Lrs14 n=1 Tax=Pyrolobus fumarii TaxID=54252 RepID=UPI001432A9B8